MKVMTSLMDVIRKPTPLRIATAALEQAERDRLTAVEQREYYAAMEEMLIRRISRLRREVVQLTQEAENEKKDSSGG
jgi:phosphoribosylcarboxyaminoimidazole (NCAIR) mutase